MLRSDVLLPTTVILLLLPACMKCGCTNGSVEIGVCLHTYLERDFSDIERIVYPRKGRAQQPHEYHTTARPLLMDGPELEMGCSRMNEVVVCLEGVLQDCQFYEDFFRLRHLVYSLKETTEWLCHKLRERFLILLVSAECMEQQRQTQCPRDQLPHNVLQKVLRLEIGQEQCSTFLSQRDCLMTTSSLRTCGATAQEVYGNITNIFLNTWCSNDRLLPYLSHAAHNTRQTVVGLLIWTTFIVTQYLRRL